MALVLRSSRRLMPAFRPLVLCHQRFSSSSSSSEDKNKNLKLEEVSQPEVGKCENVKEHPARPIDYLLETYRDVKYENLKKEAASSVEYMLDTHKLDVKSEDVKKEGARLVEYLLENPLVSDGIDIISLITSSDKVTLLDAYRLGKSSVKMTKQTEGEEDTTTPDMTTPDMTTPDITKILVAIERIENKLETVTNSVNELGEKIRSLEVTVKEFTN